MTDTSSRTASRARVAEYRALLTERKTELKRLLDGLAALVDELPPGPTKVAATQNFVTTAQETEGLFLGVGNAQGLLLDVVAEILDWSERQGHTLSAKGAELQFGSGGQRSEFIRLLDKLKAAEAAMTAAETSAQAVQDSAQKQLDEAARQVGLK